MPTPFQGNGIRLYANAKHNFKLAANWIHIGKTKGRGRHDFYKICMGNCVAE